MAGYGIKADRVRINPNFFDASEAERIALQEIENTIARTNDAARKGQDADGNGWPEYSPSYKEAIKRAAASESTRRSRSDKGRTYLRKKGGHTSPPNLYVSGTLHQSRRAFRIAKGAEGRFVPGRPNVSGSKSAPTNVQLANWLSAKRPNFHALGKVDIERILKRFGEAVNVSADRNLVQITKSK